MNLKATTATLAAAKSAENKYRNSTSGSATFASRMYTRATVLAATKALGMGVEFRRGGFTVRWS